MKTKQAQAKRRVRTHSPGEKALGPMRGEQPELPPSSQVRKERCSAPGQQAGSSGAADCVTSGVLSDQPGYHGFATLHRPGRGLRTVNGQAKCVLSSSEVPQALWVALRPKPLIRFVLCSCLYSERSGSKLLKIFIKCFVQLV